MKLINVEQNFKTVSESLAKKVPALADKVGQKRETLKFSFNGFAEAADYAELSPEIVCFYLNAGIEALARKQVQEHVVNWDFVPAIADLTIQAAYESDNAETKRARTLTKESAAEFAKFYVMFGPKLIEGFSDKAAQAGAQVIREFLVYSKQESFCRNINARLTVLAENILEQDENSEVMEYLANCETDLLEVMNALIEKFDPSKLVIVTADAL